MTEYYYLPVYKASYDLFIELFRCMKHFNREYKYTVGESIKNEAVTLIKNIYRANGSRNKRKLIQDARENIETIRLYLRLTKDLQLISLDRFVRLNEYVESISKQLTAWQKRHR